MKIVINSCHGGFGLSEEAINLWLLRKNIKAPYIKNTYVFSEWCYVNKTYPKRDDPVLVGIIEELKEKANAPYAELKIVEIPNDVDWQIEEYDGREWISEKHKIWE